MTRRQRKSGERRHRSIAEAKAERVTTQEQQLDGKLDEALKGTFPASDPFDLTPSADPADRPAGPTRKQHRS